MNAEKGLDHNFVLRGVESHPRSILKAVTWRALGSIDTFVLSYLFTGNFGAAGAIAGTEVFTKIVLFYFHERAWSLVRWGHRPGDETEGKNRPDGGGADIQRN